MPAWLYRLFTPHMEILIDDGHILIQTKRRITPTQRAAFIKAFHDTYNDAGVGTH